MNLKNINTYIAKLILLTAFSVFLSLSVSASSKSLIDDFSHAEYTSIGTSRVFISDTSVGGKSTTQFNINEGAMHFSGEVVPPRGQPGWSSMTLLLNEVNKVQDVSQYKGIVLRIRLNSGNVSISANSADVSNYDYHSAEISVQRDGRFHEVKIPFVSMRRIWSEQTQLNTKTLTSLSIVAFGLKPTKYDFAIDGISFY